MKKLLAILLCLAMLAGCCACGNDSGNKESGSEQEQKTATIPEGALTLAKLQALKTKEELAALIGIDNQEDVLSMLNYIRNYYSLLPSEKDSTEGVTSYGKTEDGYNCLTIEQAKTLIKTTMVTTENWKNYYGTYLKLRWYQLYNEDDSYYFETEEAPVFGLLDNYYISNDFYLEIYDKVSGENYYVGDEFPFEVVCDDGQYWLYTWDPETETVDRRQYNIDDFTCTKAEGVIFEYDLDPSLRYIGQWNDDLFKEVYTSVAQLEEKGEEYDNSTECVFVQYGPTNSNEYLCITGYSGFGDFVYNNDLAVRYTMLDDTVFDVNPAEQLTKEAVLQCETKEELAALFGAYSLKYMPQLLAYIENFYYHLPSENYKAAELGTWGKNEAGYYCVTIEQGKAMATPTIITTENWADFIKPYMSAYECYVIDIDGNESVEMCEEPVIGIDDSVYDYSWDACKVVLTNNKNNELIEFGGLADWPEQVSLEDGKYMVTWYDEKGKGTTEEFDPSNYTCVYANGVVYKDEIPQELIYVEYYDDETESWCVAPADQYDGDYTPSVYVQCGDTEEDIYSVSLTGFGNFVYTYQD